MPNILLLRLRGPMQSWGVSSRFSIRDTGKEPSKSGIVGLLCAALGISRDDANINNPQFEKLTRLKMGVRVLSEGVMQKDYHTAQNVAKADGGIKDTELSTRWYLADADFIVGLESDELQTLENLQNALKNPKWQLFLGRKAFPAALPVHFREGVFQGKSLEFLTATEDGLNEILRTYAKDLGLKPQNGHEQRIVLENSDGTEVRQDVPLDFAARRFSIRRVSTGFLKTKGGETDDGNLSDKNGSEPAV